MPLPRCAIRWRADHLVRGYTWVYLWGYRSRTNGVMTMPKINVYLPDDLAAQVKAAGIPVSPVCQQALAEAVRTVGRARQAIEAMRRDNVDPQLLPQLAERVLSRSTGKLLEVFRLAGAAAGAGRPVRPEHLL